MVIVLGLFLTQEVEEPTEHTPKGHCEDSKIQEGFRKVK